MSRGLVTLCLWLWVWGHGAVLAQLPAPEAPRLRILKGELLEWNVRGLSGDLLLEDDEGPRRWRCAVTADTFLTRSSIRIHPVGVRVGDRLEVVADAPGGPVAGDCVARTVYIRAPDPRKLSARQLWLTSTPGSGMIWPRGVLTFAGVVNRVEGNRLYVQTRRHGAKSFALRDDTRYSSDGRPVDVASLAAQTRVFVRANRTYEGDLEVYQVVWGDGLMTTMMGGAAGPTSR